MSDEILSAILSFKSEIDMFSGASCIAVGNSPSTMSEELGHKIDEFDFVIRFNQARIVGYEKFVGSKTSLRIVNCHIVESSLGNTDCINDCRKVFSNFIEDGFSFFNDCAFFIKDPTGSSKVAAIREKHSDKRIYTTNDQIQSLTEQISPLPTSGVIGVVLALSFFRKIHVTGFDFYESKTDHYFEEVEKYDRSCHHLDKEKELFNFLHTKGVLDFIGQKPYFIEN